MPEHAPRIEVHVLLQIIICTPYQSLYLCWLWKSAISFLVFIWGYGSVHYPGKAVKLVLVHSGCKGFAILFLGPIEIQGGKARALPPSYTPSSPCWFVFVQVYFHLPCASPVSGVIEFLPVGSTLEGSCSVSLLVPLSRWENRASVGWGIGPRTGKAWFWTPEDTQSHSNCWKW